ncbi:MAG TPA: helix-turn-helix domain-containing protein [Thermoplasmataceae archaeon]|nr:helix-turn-helix domain-containing protein [Thermoplasmatales archaeon AK]HLH86031.1 helix-turn-helix domain-containing protein [Thermoplasmataceae archaeon]
MLQAWRIVINTAGIKCWCFALSRKSKGAIEALIEVTRGDCAVTNFVSRFGESTVVDRLKIGADFTVHRITSDRSIEDLIGEMRRVSIDVTKVGKNTLWAKARSCSSCRLLSQMDTVIMSSKSLNGGRIQYRILIPSEAKLRQISHALEEADLSPKLLEIFFESEENLTEREMEIVKKAFTLGYFDTDRKISMTELAEKIGIRTPTLSDILRRAMRKIIRYYLENKSR